MTLRSMLYMLLIQLRPERFPQDNLSTLLRKKQSKCPPHKLPSLLTILLWRNTNQQYMKCKLLSQSILETSPQDSLSS